MHNAQLLHLNILCILNCALCINKGSPPQLGATLLLISVAAEVRSSFYDSRSSRRRAYLNTFFTVVAEPSL